MSSGNLGYTNIWDMIVEHLHLVVDTHHFALDVQFHMVLLVAFG